MIRPFRALRPVPARAALVSAPPYDVMNREEALAIAAGNPWSFLHVSRSEIDLPSSVSPYSAQAYERARENFERLVRECPLIEEAQPSLYVYRLRQGEHEQTGVAGAFSLDEYDSGEIRRHERTREEKEDDRTRHIVALGAQTGPVFLAYRDRAEIDREIAQTAAGTPLYDFTAPDGVTHTIWVVRNAFTLISEFSAVPRLYIADGHHRAASASRARAEFRVKNTSHTGVEDYNLLYAVAFGAGQLRILPYHRLISDLNGLSEREFLASLEHDFVIETPSTPSPERREFAMFLGGQWHRLRQRVNAHQNDAAHSESLCSTLDVSILQSRVLAPTLGIADPRTDQRIDFVGGIRGTGELEAAVTSGRAAVAFALHPTSLDDLMHIADSGAIMPPKSTWFEPKLRDGLLSLRSRK
jgi:uncharacterized protein (DUF1015 family)